MLTADVFQLKKRTASGVSTNDGRLKLNFVSCVIHQIRSLGALVVCPICIIVFVNYNDGMVVDTQFHKYYGGPFARVLYIYSS